MFCPFCLRNNVRVNGLKTYERAVYVYIEGQPQGKSKAPINVNKGASPLITDKRLKNDFNKSQNQKWRFYKCPRCKGFFKTKEQVTYCPYIYSPKKEDMDRYDAKQSRKRIDKIIENHLETENPQPIEEPKRMIQVAQHEWVIIGDKEASKTTLKNLILKNFGEEIRKDIEKDLYDLLHSGKITLDEMYEILESIKQESKSLD